jgi:hypothetical protein
MTTALLQVNREMTIQQTMRFCMFEWTNKGSLDLLACILYSKGYILSKKEFQNLFLNPGNCTKVRWNGNKLAHLAYLLYRLYKEEFIIINGNKGYFVYAENHFTDFDSFPFKKNVLKKLCWRVNNDESRYAFIRAEIDEIISYISKQQKELLRNY